MLKFSIIIPTYNRAKFITKAINSCIEQTYSNFEIIVVDDGSTDNTESVVADIVTEKLKYYKKANEERGAARNYGVEKATGDYVFFLDSDDWLAPNHLQAGNKNLKLFNYPEVLHHRFKTYFDDTKKQIDSDDINTELTKELLKGNLVGCMLFVRKDIMIKHPYSTNRNLSGTEDKLHVLELSSRYNIRYSNIKTITIREHENRSMAAVSIDSWQKQLDAFLYELGLAKSVISFYGKSGIAKIKAYYIQMISIKYMLAGNKLLAFQLYFKSVILYPLAIFNKNFLRLFFYSLKK